MNIKERLRNLPPYQPIEPFEILSERLGRPIHDLVKLNANENPYGPAPEALAALANLSFPNIYPDPESRILRSTLADYTGVPMEFLVASAGADELLDLILRLVLEPGGKVLNLVPTFGMYAFDTLLNGGEIVNIERNPDFSIPFDQVSAAIETESPTVLFLTTPNNPDGTLPSREEIQRIIDLPVLVVLDEAYIEFCDDGGFLGQERSFIQDVKERENLIVLRTFSKWAGLAGLRVGYGAFPHWMHSALWNCKQPYNVNVAAQQAATASLGSLPFLAANVEKIKAERQRMYQRLAEIPYLEPVPGSQSNYILCRVNDRPAATLNADLIRQGIFTRYYNSGRLKDYLRISIGKPEDTDILIDMLYALGNPALAAGSALRPVRPAPDRGRKASVQRATQETFIEASINLDGSGACQVNTGIPFFDHMLTQIAVHGLFDLAVNASGDLEVDVHHTIEDVALTLGNAFLKALGDRKGIVRMADVRVPMDETLAELTLDLSGRPYAVVHINWTAEHAGGIPVSMFTHFFESFAGELRCNLHLSIPYGRDTHHQAEAAFKALARALSTATRIDPRRQGAIPSSKGELF